MVRLSKLRSAFSTVDFVRCSVLAAATGQDFTKGEMMMQETIEVPGLGAPAEIAIDQWGIPHLRAETTADLYFLQGYNSARDRLWQIDLWRKRGLGLLAAHFGPGYLAQDRAARLFLYRGDMAAEWAAYSDDAEAICQAFVKGINAYIDGLDATPDRLPVEFALTGTRPERWQADDVVRIRSHARTRNATSEVLRARVMSASGPETDLLRQNLEPAKAPHVADGLDLATIPLAVADVFQLALAPVTFEDARLQATLAEAPRWSKVTAAGDIVADEEGPDGSNNWVVHGSRTASGRPILANDPHRAHSVPGLRYLVHLTAPGLDLIGAGEPCIPGISLGHNGTSAFGLTLFFGHDQEDVYVYETAAEDPTMYRYGDGWEAMRIVTERTAVKGEGEQTHELKFTRHGAVVYEDHARRRAYAVRSVWFEPGSAPYFASILTMRAKSFGAFRTGMARWGVPAVNQVYADTSGTIAWLPAGFSPVRPNWDGLLPVPGDGRYEWAGFFPAVDWPVVVDPEDGYFATANEQNLPTDWPHDEKQVGYEWAERSRMDRIVEVFSAGGAHTIEASCALQMDVKSLPAERLTALVRNLAAGLAEEAKAVFARWDHRLRPESGAAALFEVWWSKHLRGGVVSRLVADTDSRALIAPGDVATILAVLEAPDRRFGDDPIAARDGLLATTLATAWADCVALLGADPGRWAWGTLHKGYFAHALSATCVAKDAGLDVGPLGMGGSESTPMNARYRNSDFRVMTGASVRLVIDVGAWDSSVAINAPGQSGDPKSPHYGDLAELWAEGRYVPLLYTRGAIAEATRTLLTLMPTNGSQRLQA